HGPSSASRPRPAPPVITFRRLNMTFSLAGKPIEDAVPPAMCGCFLSLAPRRTLSHTSPTPEHRPVPQRGRVQQRTPRRGRAVGIVSRNAGEGTGEAGGGAAPPPDATYPHRRGRNAPPPSQPGTTSPLAGEASAARAPRRA